MTEYVAKNLITSYTYNFKIRARNAHDLGDFSAELGILVAEKPVTPEAPVLTLDGDNVIVTWVEPPNSGQPILGYRVYLQRVDGSFNIDFTYCDGADSEIFINLECVIPSKTFMSE